MGNKYHLTGSLRVSLQLLIFCLYNLKPLKINPLDFLQVLVLLSNK